MSSGRTVGLRSSALAPLDSWPGRNGELGAHVCITHPLQELAKGPEPEETHVDISEEKFQSLTGLGAQGVQALNQAN